MRLKSFFGARLNSSLLTVWVMCQGANAQTQSAGNDNSGDGASQAVVLRLITGAEMKLIYEFPTPSVSDENLGVQERAFEKGVGSGYVIVDRATSQALSNDILRLNIENSRTISPIAVNVTDDGTSVSMSDDEYARLRYVIARERFNESNPYKADTYDFPVSLLYDNPDLDQQVPEGLCASSATSPVFMTSGNNPWISAQNDEASVFNIYFKNGSTKYYLTYIDDADEPVFRAVRNDPGANLAIYQYDNIGLTVEANPEGGVDIAVSHRDDDAVMKDVANVAVLFNDGTPVDIETLLSSGTLIALCEDGAWKSLLKAVPEQEDVASRAEADAAPATTVWLAPCYTVDYEDKKYSMPIGALQSVTVKSPEKTDPDESDMPTSIITSSENTAGIPSVYYTLQGQAVAMPVPGNIYIKLSGSSASKVLYLSE